LSITRSTNADRYPFDLASVYRNWRVYDPSFALSRDPDVDEKILLDDVIAAGVAARKHKVAARSWTIEPAQDDPLNKRAASIVEQILKRIDKFGHARFNLADAVIKGRAYGYISGGYVVARFGDGKPRRWWTPTKIEDIDRRRFRRVSRNEKGVIRTWWEWFNVGTARWTEIPHEATRALISHVYDDDESNLGYGRGLMDSLFFAWRGKRVALEQGLIGLTRWAQGLVVVTLDSLRDASTGKTNDNLVTSAIAEINKHRSEHVLVKGKEDELEVVTGGMEGHQIVMDFVQYFDSTITRLLMGSLLPTGGGSEVGSNARAEVEDDASEALIQFDRNLLDDTLTASLVQLVWDLNRDNFAQLGLFDAEPGRFNTTQERMTDPKVSSDVIATMLGAGIPLKRTEVYEKTGFSVPGDDDEVIEGHAPAPSTFGGIPGLSMPSPFDKQPATAAQE
jgi:hypothetical protein